MIKKSDLSFSYPEELVATEPCRPSRVMYWDGKTPKEVQMGELLTFFESGDVLVVNNTKVVKRRVYTEEGLEILFVDPLPSGEWSVLFPARKIKVGEGIALPGGVELRLLEKGLPQKVSVSKPLDEDYFETYGQLALPPYIQKARGERQNLPADERWYQTAWAKTEGSTAAPTASLHFSSEDLQVLEESGVNIATLTLHVGLGTFLPVRSEDLEGHKMHSERVQIHKSTLNQIAHAKAQGGKVWALGTTVARALESWPLGYFSETPDSLYGNTDIFIKPGFDFRVVDVLMTNFHQPESTLLALVGAFAGLDNVKKTYQWAIARKFRLFSYGDLSVWHRP